MTTDRTDAKECDQIRAAFTRLAWTRLQQERWLRATYSTTRPRDLTPRQAVDALRRLAALNGA